MPFAQIVIPRSRCVEEGRAEALTNRPVPGRYAPATEPQYGSTPGSSMRQSPSAVVVIAFCALALGGCTSGDASAFCPYEPPGDTCPMGCDVVSGRSAVDHGSCVSRSLTVILVC